MSTLDELKNNITAIAVCYDIALEIIKQFRENYPQLYSKLYVQAVVKIAKSGQYPSIWPKGEDEE